MSPRRKKSPTSSSDRKIQASAYLQLVDEVRPAGEANIIRKLVDWARNAGFTDNFNHGSRGTSFLPKFEHNGKRYWPLSVQANGTVVIQLRWLKDQEPFNDSAKREELLQRLRELSDLRITPAGIDGYPKVAVSALCDEMQFRKFTAILDWLLQQIHSMIANWIRPVV